MKHLIRLLLGVIFVAAVSPASAQTAKSLFAGGATVGKDYSVGFTFYDSTCRQVTSHGAYPPGALNWFQTSVYCNGFSEPIVTFVYSRYDYPSPSPIVSCSGSRSSNSNLIFYSFTNCSAYVGAYVQAPAQPKDLLFWAIGNGYTTPYISLRDPSCSQFTQLISSGYSTPRYRATVNCGGVSGSVLTIDYNQGGGAWLVTKNPSPKVVTNTAWTADYVKLLP